MDEQRAEQHETGASAAPRPLNLNQLRTFLAVHQSGSFTAAAQLLGLSQPTVTAQIRALETHLGRELFERRARGITPSPFADELAARAASPLAELAAITEDDAGGHVDPVYLAGPAELLAVQVMPALAPLAERGVRLRVSAGLTEPLLRELRAGRHDLVIATYRPRGRTLSAVPLSDEEFVLVAAPVWAERTDLHRPGVDVPRALHGMPMVAYAEDLPIARRYWRHVFDRRLTSQAAITMPDLRGVLAAVLAGAGYSVLPRYLCAAALDSGALVLLHDPDDPPINTGYLLQRPGAPVNPHVALVRERLLQAARDWR